MTTPAITFTSEAWQALREQSDAAYPFEGCGLLIGPLSAEKVVNKVIPLKNVLRDEGRGRFDFAFSPQEFMKKQMSAEVMGLDVIGIYHTHPDHPPRPSSTDAAQPMLAGWINIIASVRGDGVGGGRFHEAKAWWRDDETTPFVEIALINQ